MPTQIQLRRGTDTQNAGFTGAAGEPTVNTTNWSLHVHDGATQGGYELLRADLANIDGAAASPQFTNGTYTGNLEVQGNLTVDGNATIAGNLTFGDAATDTVSFSADVDSNILPEVSQTYSIGSGTQEWAGVYAQDGFFTNNVDVSNQLSVNTNKFTVDSSGNIAASGDVTLTANTGTGISTISPSLDLLVDASNGSITLKGGANVVAEVGSAGSFYVQDSTYTNRLAVSETGRVSINEAYALPLADGSANQALVTNGLGTVSFATIDTDSVTEATNLYYTDARVQTYLSGGTATTIETTGNVIVGGDLTVNGTTTTLNTTTLDIEDLNITVAKNSTNSGTSDGAGLTIDLGSDGTVTMNWSDAGNYLAFSSDVYVTGALTSNGNFAVNGTSNFAGNLTVNAHVLPGLNSDGTTGYDLGSPTQQFRHLYVSGSSVYLAGRRMRISNDGTIIVNTNNVEGYPESADLTVATNQGVLATAAALSIALGSI